MLPPGLNSGCLVCSWWGAFLIQGILPYSGMLPCSRAISQYHCHHIWDKLGCELQLAMPRARQSVLLLLGMPAFVTALGVVLYYRAPQGLQHCPSTPLRSTMLNLPAGQKTCIVRMLEATRKQLLPELPFPKGHAGDCCKIRPKHSFLMRSMFCSALTVRQA